MDLTTLKHELDSLRTILALTESEDSWDTIAKGVTRLTYLCQNGACDFPPELTAFIRSFSRPLNNAMCSERSRLSGAAIDLQCALASGLGAELEPLLPLFFPTLLTLCTRTNKVFITRARTCILAFIETTQLPAILPYLSEASKDKSVSLRITAAESVLACLNCFNPPDLEKEARARLVEDVIRVTARDASADVRKVSRKMFEAYKALLPGRVDKFVSPLTPVMKKYLDIKVKPSTNSNRPAHTRSASSSVLPVAGESKTVADGRPDEGNPMPPPNSIPIRRGPPARAHVITASRSTSSVQDRKRTTSAVSTLSGGSGSSRPPSAAAVAPPKAIEKPSRFPTSSVPPTNARRFGRPTPVVMPTATSGGASRLNRRADDITASEGPVRPSASKAVVGHASVKAEAGGNIRVMGGARRVPLPPPAEDASAKKETSGDIHSTSESVVKSNILSRSTSKPAISKPGTNKADEKPKPVPRPIVKKSSTTTFSSSILSKAPSKLSRSDTEEARKQGVKSVDVTQLTLAQLSRVRAAAVDRKGKETAKPGWGRPATSKAVVVTKGLSIRGKAQDTKPMSRPMTTGKVAPKDISLPPSPKHERTATSVPLPPSPTPKEVDAATDTPRDVEDVPVIAAEEENPTRLTDMDAINTLLPALPVIPDIQEPAVSTPIASQKPLAAPAGTPISTLLTSIQQGFLFTPYSPLSPPQSYLPPTADDDLEIDLPTPIIALQRYGTPASSG